MSGSGGTREQVGGHNHPGLTERVREDYDLRPAEKEITLTLSKADERARVYAEIGGVMQRLLAHPLFEVESLRVLGEGAVSPKRLGAGEVPGAEVVGVGGTIPKGALKIRRSARTTSGYAAILPEVNSLTGGDA